MITTIMIVEDDIFTARLLCSFLEREGFNVKKAADAGRALSIAFNHNIDAAIVDISLPSGNGINLVSELRQKQKVTFPILFFTSNSNISCEVKALSSGGDDFVHKDKGLKVLFLRLTRLLKIAKQPLIGTETHTTNSLSINGILLDKNKNQLHIPQNNFTINLRDKESKTLFYLLDNKDQLVTRDELSIINYGYCYDGVTRSIDLLVSRVRKELISLGIPREVIQTQRGCGYYLNSELFVPKL
ncbi:response regulator transcription factor [Vibrio sp. F13]|uniref:response regulator transcription factor n=1 Tax=Vibrio sp. F13 TaxID=2070777 RepID=UPI0010BD01A1|nr:response regulator transcription factor [Vibrio sp. F13]TKG09026.1 response regulator transcription factor [Vibrio sp. F13]